MSQKPQDENPADWTVVNRHDEPVFIPADIEHHNRIPAAHNDAVGSRENLANVLK